MSHIFSYIYPHILHLDHGRSDEPHYYNYDHDKSGVGVKNIPSRIHICQKSQKKVLKPVWIEIVLVPPMLSFGRATHSQEGED